MRNNELKKVRYEKNAKNLKQLKIISYFKFQLN